MMTSVGSKERRSPFAGDQRLSPWVDRYYVSWIGSVVLCIGMKKWFRDRVLGPENLAQPVLSGIPSHIKTKHHASAAFLTLFHTNTEIYRYRQHRGFSHTGYMRVIIDKLLIWVVDASTQERVLLDPDRKHPKGLNFRMPSARQLEIPSFPLHSR